MQASEKLPDILRSAPGPNVFNSASFGIALSDKSYDQPEDLPRDTDTAMCRAKWRGKDRCGVFNVTMRYPGRNQWQFEADLQCRLPTNCLKIGPSFIETMLAENRWSWKGSEALFLQPASESLPPSVGGYL